jgi:ubiquinone/menaquinone biosynthesis C-methylase UbiE
MTATEHEGSYKASEIHPDIEKEIGRLRAQALWGWEKESRNLRWFGLRDGMSVLEVGSGPGFITEQLLAMFPNVHITCVELDPDLIERATKYLGSKGFEGRYEIIRGNLMKMDFPDNTFDFAFARLVFQHLPNPVGAAEELFRVLKPGGTLAITDVDSGLQPIIGPPDEEADAIAKKMSGLQKQLGGNREIGRRLWRTLKGVGFTDMDLEALAIHSDIVPIETMIPFEWDPDFFEPALKAGVITPEDVERLHQAHLEFVASDEKYALFPVLMVAGRKPGVASSERAG